MSFSTRSLSAWLSDIEKRHPTEIDLGLDRVREVYDNLSLKNAMPRTVVVAGTNGKGSTVQALNNGLAALGLTVATYTSPHFHRFNERIRLNGKEVSDDELTLAFERVEQARGNTSLTYFEFTTLSAYVIFAERALAGELDVAICEVGLGGRLDAVNVIDADVSTVVSIGLDHQDWLGDTVEKIAHEKAGVFRAGKVSLIGESFPKSVELELRDKGIVAQRFGRDFGVVVADSSLYNDELSDFGGAQMYNQSSSLTYFDAVADSTLPANNLCLAMQACIELVETADDWKALHHDFSLSAQAISSTSVFGRLELIDGEPLTLWDVAHNGAAAECLSEYVDSKFGDREVVAVFSCLKDKDIREIVSAINSCVASWYIAEIDNPRALPVSDIKSVFFEFDATLNSFDNLTSAYEAARDYARKVDAVLIVFGSFYVLEALRGKARV